MAVSSIALRLAALDALTAVGADLAAATLITYSNGIAPGPGVIMSQLVESAYDGYAAVAAQAFGAAYLDEAGRPCLSAPSVQFESTGGTVEESIVGWALVNAGKTALYYMEALPVPRAITGPLQGVVIQPTVRYGD